MCIIYNIPYWIYQRTYALYTSHCLDFNIDTLGALPYSAWRGARALWYNIVEHMVVDIIFQVILSFSDFELVLL